MMMIYLVKMMIPTGIPVYRYTKPIISCLWKNGEVSNLNHQLRTSIRTVSTKWKSACHRHTAWWICGVSRGSTISGEPRLDTWLAGQRHHRSQGWGSARRRNRSNRRRNLGAKMMTWKFKDDSDDRGKILTLPGVIRMIWWAFVVSLDKLRVGLDNDTLATSHVVGPMSYSSHPWKPTCQQNLPLRGSKERFSPSTTCSWWM